MKKSKIGVIAMAAILATQAVYAQGFFQPIEPQAPKRDTAVMNLLLAAASGEAKSTTYNNGETLNYTMASIRGGKGSKKPLGQYLVEPNMEFRSEYIDQPVESMCDFAYDLHAFIVSKRGDYRSMATNSNGGEYVSYEKQKEFAISWWKRRYPRYEKLGGIFKDWFINDALIDGTNVYNWSRRNLDGGADYIAWADGAISALMKKKP